MALESIAGVLGVLGTVVGAAGYVFIKNRTIEKKDDKEELKEIRENLRKMAQVDEVAELELEQSYSKTLKTRNEIVKERDYLKQVVEDITESRRKQAMDILDGTRSELCELAKKNERASKELKDSYVKRITTEKAALREVEKLSKIIGVIKDEQRKVAFDKLNRLRDRLYVLSIDNERANSELEDSYNKQIASEDQAKRESRRLEFIIKDVEEHKRKVAFDNLTIVRDELYKISLDDEDAKLHLQESYNRRVTTERAIIEETEKLSAIIDSITEERRKQAMDHLLQVRGDLYSKSRSNDVIKRALNDSYNKRIVERNVAYKEIERLTEVEENEDFKRRTILK